MCAHGEAHTERGVFGTTLAYDNVTYIRRTRSYSGYPDWHAAVKCFGRGRRKKAHGEAWCQALRSSRAALFSLSECHPAFLSSHSYKAGSKRLSCKLIRLHQTLTTPFPPQCGRTGTETALFLSQLRVFISLISCFDLWWYWVCNETTPRTHRDPTSLELTDSNGDLYAAEIMQWLLRCVITISTEYYCIHQQVLLLLLMPKSNSTQEKAKIVEKEDVTDWTISVL